VDQWSAEASRLPGVAAVGAVTNLPIVSAAGFTGYHRIEGRPPARPGSEPIGGVELVSTAYFAAMGMPIIEGRNLTADDTASTPPVAVVNDAARRLYWPDGSPLGARLHLGPPGTGGPALPGFAIVGVVRGVKYSLDAEVRPRIYLAFAQGGLPAASLGFVLGPALEDPGHLAAAVREATARVDPLLPLTDVRPYVQVLSSSLERQRLQTVLIGSFGLVALVLGAVGVYGVVSHHVSQHAREIGIRMALGAGGRTVMWTVVRDSLRPVLIGAGIGLLVTIAGARALADAATLGASGAVWTLLALVALLIGVAVLAAWLPARRAAGIDPVSAMRGA
jgi:putative ABC transport system permease protein